MFGSQRRFFNKVYAKLKSIPIPDSVKEASNVPKTAEIPMIANSKILEKHSFMTGEKYWQCLKCRAVPFEFRAPGALHFSCPTTVAVEHHAMGCQKDGVYLGLVRKAKEELTTSNSESLSDNSTFRALVSVMVGDDDQLTRLFAKPEDPDWSAETTSGLWRSLPSNVNVDEVEASFQQLSKELKLESSQLQRNPRWVRFLNLISPGFQCPILTEDPPQEAQASSSDAAKPDNDNTPTSPANDSESLVTSSSAQMVDSAIAEESNTGNKKSDNDPDQVPPASENASQDVEMEEIPEESNADNKKSDNEDDSGPAPSASENDSQDAEMETIPEDSKSDKEKSDNVPGPVPPAPPAPPESVSQDDKMENVKHDTALAIRNEAEPDNEDKGPPATPENSSQDAEMLLSLSMAK